MEVIIKASARAAKRYLFSIIITIMTVLHPGAIGLFKASFYNRLYRTGPKYFVLYFLPGQDILHLGLPPAGTIMAR